MKLNVAYDIVTGRSRVEEVNEISEIELIQLLSEIRLIDKSDIVCIECDPSITM